MKQLYESGPALPVALPISDVPVAPVVLSFASDPPPAPRLARAQKAGARPSPARQVAGWAADLALLGALAGVHVAVAAQIVGSTHTADILLAAPRQWAALFAALAIAFSWLTVSLFGRTPGMALTGQRLRRTRGGSPDTLLAFCRAALAVLSGALGLFGFAVAFVDRSGRTLHDRLCGCACVVD
jgi:hypothetical protein